jgi:hypothetical protein
MFLQDTFRKVHVSSFGSITSIEHTLIVIYIILAYLRKTSLGRAAKPRKRIGIDSF